MPGFFCTAAVREKTWKWAQTLRKPSRAIPMRELDGRYLVSRIPGRQALERRLRGVLIAVHRFARGRAMTAADVQWCARAIDGLTTALAPGQERGRHEG